MGSAGINLESVKIKNRQTILTLINSLGAISRKDIAQQISLTSASVTQLCTEMIQEGLIIEKGQDTEERKVGRKKIIIDIDYNSKVVLCVNIETYKTVIVVSNLQGDILQENRIDTDITISAKLFLEKIVIPICQKMIQSYQKKENLLGIGITVSGIVDKKLGISHNSTGIWNEDVPIKQIFQKKIKTNIIVENNINAFAQAEMIYGEGRKTSNILFLKWYPGVGSTVVIQNQVYENRNPFQRSSDIGHCMVENLETRCKCGRMGCLETVTSFEIMKENILSIYNEEHTPILFHETKGNREEVPNRLKRYIMDNIHQMDEAVKQILDEACHMMVKKLFNALYIVACDKVVVYGEFFENDFILQMIIKYFKKYDVAFYEYDANFIIRSTLSLKSHYIGSLAIIMQEYFFNTGGMTIDTQNK